MDKWESINLAPKDSHILGWCSINETQVVSWFEPLYNKWISHLSDSDDDEDPNIPSGITHWMELPEPPKKKHYCKKDNWVCKFSLDTRIVTDKKFIFFNENEMSEKLYLPTNECPLCGENA